MSKAGHYFQLALNSMAQEDYRLALGWMLKNDSVGNLHPYHSLQDSITHAGRYITIYEHLGDYKMALQWAKDYARMIDTAAFRQVRTSLAESDERYQTLEKEKKIQVLQLEQEKAKLNQQNMRLAVALMILGLLLLGVFAYFNHKKNQALLLQREMEHEQQVREQESRENLLALRAMIEGEDKERQRLSRDLHDGLGSILASLKYKLLEVHDSIQHPELPILIDGIDRSIKEMRRISHNLMPAVLNHFGLEIALKDLVDELKTGVTKIELQLFHIPHDLDRDLQVQIYRIIQELLTNALKHAFPKQIIVQCSKNEDIIFITVEDDGIGFDSDALFQRKNKGIGIKNIDTRVRYLQGKMDVVSGENEGTTVNIELHVDR